MKTQIWYQNFKQQIDEADFSLHEDSSLSPLRQVLEAKIISDSQYLSWALNHFKIPVLSSSFFENQSNTQDIFTKWSSSYRWSVECLPIAEWDGSVIIACLNPEVISGFPTHYIPVLATSVDLENRWQQYTATPNAVKSKGAIPASIPSMDELPDGFLSDFASSAGAPADSVSFDDLGLNLKSQSEDEMANAESSYSESSISESSISDSESSNVDDLLDLNFSTDKSSPNIPLPAAESKPSTSKSKLQLLEGLNDALKEENPSPAAKVPPAAHVREDSSIIETSAPASMTSHKILTPKGSSQTDDDGQDDLIYNSSATSSSRFEKIKKRSKDLLDLKLGKIFTDMETHFEKVMVLSIDDSGDYLLPFAWNKKFEPPKSSQYKVKLHTPSIFNIAYTTQKPFHGYVSINDINEEFFENWNAGSIPDHVTIVPVFQGTQISGVLVGLGEKSAYNSKSLAAVEQMAQEFYVGLTDAA